MLITGVVCLCAALASLLFGLRALARPRPDGPDIVARALAPAQLTSAFMLAAAGTVALLDPPGALLLVVVCVVGAVGTIATASWLAARYLARREADPGCAGSCAGCSLPCG